MKAFYWKNVEAQRAVARERHHRNREKRIEQQRAYREANLDALNARRRPRARETFKQRYGVDLNFTLKHRLRALMRGSLTNGREGKRMREILEYGTEELKAHIESKFIDGMSWGRFLIGEIHIDHIVPVSRFDIENVESAAFKSCWALSNLQPLWAKDNLSKGAKILV